MIKLFTVILFFTLALQAHGYERVWHEDCEDTVFTEHFMEDNYGGGELVHWNTMKAAMSQSTVSPKRGSYSMTYDSYVYPNPHAVVGWADHLPQNNLSDFSLLSVEGRYFYFRWYQRWIEDIDWGSSCAIKLIYMNYQNWADFTFILSTAGSSSLHSALYDGSDYSPIPEATDYEPMVNREDMQWHLMELIIDVGTTGGGNGSLKFSYDGDAIFDFTNLTYNPVVTSNPIMFLESWPSNLSGTCGTGSAQTWLDDLEIYTLDSLSDIPPELGEASATYLPTGLPNMN